MFLTRLVPRRHNAASQSLKSTGRFFTKKSDDKEDLFGLDDGDGKLGSTLPPKYKRDATTGRMTGDIEREVTEEERKLLKMDPMDQANRLSKRVRQHYETHGDVNKLGERVRRQDMSLNVLGRSVKAQADKESLDDGTKLGRDEAGFSNSLTAKEFDALSAFLRGQHEVDIQPKDIPVQEKQAKSAFNIPQEDDPDNAQLTQQWLTEKAQREWDDVEQENPYSDLLPGDLNPTRLVNRKRAKQIPVSQLHHNNIALLRTFLTPTGQIQHRVQTRLGARDQRRVSKLIRRARCMGLIPYVGQFKEERLGWINAPDIHETRPWERELERRGLKIKRDKYNN